MMQKILTRLAAISLALVWTSFASLAHAQQSAAISRDTRERAVCNGAAGYAADFGGRRTFLWRPQWLNAIKSGNGNSARIRNQVVSRANLAMRHGPYTVTDKTKTPASGDKHDYYSMGPYWWPDPAKPNGEPYLRRDGVANPERNSESFDAKDLSSLSEDVAALSLAYFYTDRPAYAQKAASLIRAWFLDPATRMNPNFAYSQAIPGVSSGRAEGVIDGHRLVGIIESVGLLTPSGALSETEMEGLRSWFGALAGWMQTSEIGQEERAKANNHGIFYDFLLSHFSLFAGNTQTATSVIRDFPQVRMARQFGIDGRLEEELARTRSWHYVNWTLGATGKLAGLGECVGQDLWRATTTDGRSLRRSISWLSAYVAREDKWTFPESAFSPGGNLRGAREIALETFRILAWGFGDTDLDQLADYYGRLEPSADEHFWLAPMPRARQDRQ